ncbi:MAG: glycerophosphodiester phosphodiesterase [Gammaproteobacteria bacterium]
MTRAVRYLLLVLIALPVIGSASVLGFGLIFESKAAKTRFLHDDCHKVWSHRGNTGRFPENSLEGYRDAVAAGAAGLELDIWFDEALGDFVVSHDRPYALFDGKPLRLSRVFAEFGPRTQYWLDFKNLETLAPGARGAALRRMDEITASSAVRTRVLIESPALPALAPFTQAGFFTSYWISFNENLGRLSFHREVARLRWAYLRGDFSALSMEYGIYSEALRRNFLGVPFLLFTVNDLATLDRLTGDPAVRIVLTDEPGFLRLDTACSP